MAAQGLERGVAASGLRDYLDRRPTSAKSLRPASHCYGLADAAVRRRSRPHVEKLVERYPAYERQRMGAIAERRQPPAADLCVDAVASGGVGVEGLPVDTAIVRSTRVSLISSAT